MLALPSKRAGWRVRASGAATFGAAAVAATLTAAGCGGSGDQTRHVRLAVTSFEHATAQRDYATICGDLLAARLLAKLARVGLPCERALRVGLGGVRAPRLAVRAVDVDGDHARVVVRTTAAGQPPSTDTLRLVREDGTWRIDELAAAGAE